jgi:hypothetical protein
VALSIFERESRCCWSREREHYRLTKLVVHLAYCFKIVTIPFIISVVNTG